MSEVRVSDKQPQLDIDAPRNPCRGWYSVIAVTQSRNVPSRKGFLTKPLPKELSASERDWPTAAAVTAAVLAGAHIVRVHAVREMTSVVRVADEIRKYHREH